MNLRAATLATLLSLPAIAGCTARAFTTTQCQRDDQCGDAHACAGGVCLARQAPPTTWAIELAPPNDSPAALTELTGPTAATGPAEVFDLMAGAKVPLLVTISGDAPAAPLTAAHLVLSVPATIPGRPDLQIEADLPAAKDAGPPTFKLQIPKIAAGRTGWFQILPLAPADASYGPVRAKLPLTPTVDVALPAKKLTVRGRLVSALGDARVGFTARAYLGTDLVSNVGVTGADGVFSLVVPTAPELAGTSPGVTVNLEPPMGAADPRFTSRAAPLTTNTDLGDVALPPFAQPNVYRFVVHGGADDGPAVSGAVLRAWTLLADVPVGRTDFIRAGRTNAMGEASLGLLAGTTNALRVYDVAVAPPPESPYALRCIAEFPLSSGGTEMMPANLPAIVLTRRTKVRGVVTGHDGTPAAGVTLLATRTAADGSTPCSPDVGAAPATATTDEAGAFELPLDSGLYRFDLDPPAGSPFPRLTETNVVVPASPGMTSDHSVTLAVGAVVEGTARGPDGAGVPLAAVRFFQPAASGMGEPLLQAQVRTDMQGHFRAIIPVAPLP